MKVLERFSSRAIFSSPFLSSLDSISRVVKKGVNTQRPWPTASARRAKVSSYPHHKRLLSQVSRLAERGDQPPQPEAVSTQEPRVSTPFATDCSEVESETALEDFMSANASFRLFFFFSFLFLFCKKRKKNFRIGFVCVCLSWSWELELISGLCVRPCIG